MQKTQALTESPGPINPDTTKFFQVAINLSKAGRRSADESPPLRVHYDFRRLNTAYGFDALSEKRKGTLS